MYNNNYHHHHHNNNVGYKSSVKKLLSNGDLFNFFQKFEGDIERENAESLAADIAEFLNNRTKRSRAGTVPVNIDPIYYKTFSFKLSIARF